MDFVTTTINNNNNDITITDDDDDYDDDDVGDMVLFSFFDLKTQEANVLDVGFQN